MMRITRTTSMTRSLFLLLLLFSSFIPDRANAWISSTTSLSSSPLHVPVVGRKRSRTNHHHRRQHQYFHEKRRIFSLRSTIVTRSSFLLHQSSRDHDDDDDDDGTIDVEEEEFYHPDFDDDDANNANNDTDDDDDDDDDDNDNDTDLKIKRRTKTTTTNKDEEFSKAWDDAVINNKEEEGNVSRDLEEVEEEGMISNLSVLQQRLQQQIREQKKKGRPQKPQQQQPNTKRVQLDDDTLTEFQKWGKDLDDRKQQQQQQQQQQQMKQNHNIDINEGQGKLQSDVYIDTLQRTQEKLLEITTTTANGGMVSSDISDMQKKLAEIQQQQTLKQQQQEAQQEAQHQRDDDDDNDDDDDDGFDIEKGEDEETYKAKNLDDHTLAEWEELENQLKSEQDEERRILLRSRNGNNDDAAAMMTGLFSEEDNDDNEMNNNNNNSNNNSYNISPRLDDILPQSEEEEFLDEAAILDKISSSTTENKKVVTESEYEVTGDGVFLSAEAYQQACDNANTDGSLNFGKTNTSDGSSSSSNNKKKRFLSPSVLEALKAKPMAPYGEEEEEEVSGPEKKKKKKKKVITLEDLSQQVTRSRRLVEDNPEAQEELHRRLMAEEPTFENDESDLFKEVLTNPQKASEFWNQEYIEKQNEESSALEKLLDQRMRQLEELEEQKKKSRNKNVNNTRKVSADAQKQQQKIIDRDIYFASSKKEKDERNKIIESDRLERSKNIAKFYRDTEDDSDWGGFVTKEDRNIIKNENDFKNNNDNDNDDDNDDDNNDDDEHQVENVLEENQKTKEDSEWVLVEDPTSEEDPFYWNEVSGEMRWEPPSES